MKFTYNWLKDFVNLKLPPKVLAEKLTMAGLEVESLVEKDGDWVFEVEITSNRPDWLSVIGVSREVAAITKSGFRSQKSQVPVKIRRPEKGLDIKIENKTDCPYYSAKIIKGVKVGASPDWLKKRLELIGVRSVNNIVDITNYLLFETGEPMHAFDLDRLSEPQIFVRRAKKDETIITIDAESRRLDSNILVIADKNKPVAIAGIMGGKDTEVSFATKNILLEAAIFNPVTTRRARQLLGLQTDSSYRFERGIAIETAKSASNRCARLITEISGGELVLEEKAGGANKKEKTIILKQEAIAKVLGKDIPLEKTRSILSGLGFKIKPKAKGTTLVTVPASRQDILSEIDLIEEASRVFGYELIPTTIPKVLPQLNISGNNTTVSFIKNILLALGLNEVITYSLIDREMLKDFTDVRPVEIENPLSKEQEVLRPTIIPSLLSCVRHNLNQKQNFVNIFEIAKIFPMSANGEALEQLTLGIALCGEKPMLLESGLVKEKMGIMHLKGCLEVLLERLGVKNFDFIMGPANGVLLTASGQTLGSLKKIGKDILDNFEIKNKDVVVAEVSLEKLLPLVDLGRKFVLPARYPGITRDISIVLKEGISAKSLLDACKEKAAPLLQEIKVTDYYRGKQIPAGYRGLTLTCIYRVCERTLTEAEVNPLHAGLCGLLSEKFGAILR